MTLAQTRSAIKGTLEAVQRQGWKGYDFEPLKPVTPCFVVGWPNEIELNDTLDGDQRYIIPVRILINYQADVASDDVLEEVLPEFVNALHANKTLDGLIDDLACIAVNSFGFVETAPGQRMLTATIHVDVLA